MPWANPLTWLCSVGWNNKMWRGHLPTPWRKEIEEVPSRFYPLCRCQLQPVNDWTRQFGSSIWVFYINSHSGTIIEKLFRRIDLAMLSLPSESWCQQQGEKTKRWTNRESTLSFVMLPQGFLIWGFGAFPKSDSNPSVLFSELRSLTSVWFSALPFSLPTKLCFPAVGAEVTVLNKQKPLWEQSCLYHCCLKFWLWKTKQSII